MADQVALAIVHALDYERLRGAQAELDVKSARLKLLLELTSNLAANQGSSSILRQATVGVRRLMRSDLALLGLLDSENGRFHVNTLNLLDDAVLDEKALDSLGEMLGNHVLSTGKPWIGDADDFAQIEMQTDARRAVSGFKKSCVVPLVSRDQVLGVLALSKREDAAYTGDEVDFLVQLSTQLAVAVENALVCGDLPNARNSLDEERVYPENEIRSELKLGGIVGKSAALQHLVGQIEVVAPTDSTVLIQGETGTGKELIARAIHTLSKRRDRTFCQGELCCHPFRPA